MITKDFNNTDITQDNNLSILDNLELVKIVSSNRVGVTKDLRRKLRFYVKGSKFVSKL